MSRTLLLAVALLLVACGNSSRDTTPGGGGGVDPGASGGEGGAADGEGAGGVNVPPNGGEGGGEATVGGGEGEGEGEEEAGEEGKADEGGEGGEGGDGAEGDDGDEEGEGGEGDDGGEEGEPYVVPEFGVKGTRILEVMANAVQGLRRPRDLEFNPERPTELWVADERLEAMIILFDAPSDERRAEVRADAAGRHFMASVSGIAFGAPDTFASCQESRNEIDPRAPDFMGPSLWSSDLDIFAVVGQRGENGMNGSHLDMLHQSPLCKGIAHEEGNAYWVADGAGGPRGSGGLPHIVRYDFGRDHGPGRSDHSDGRVRRYVEAQFHPVEGVSSHMERDPNSDWLYFVETGRGMVMRLDTSTGEVTKTLRLNHEELAEYAEVTGVTVEEWVSEGLDQPSGIAIGEERIFVSDYGSKEIVAYDHDGVELGRIDTKGDRVMGLELGPEGRLWFVDTGFAEVVRVLPEG